MYIPILSPYVFMTLIYDTHISGLLSTINVPSLEPSSDSIALPLNITMVQAVTPTLHMSDLVEDGYAPPCNRVLRV